MMLSLRRASTPTESTSIVSNANNVHISGGSFSAVQGDVTHHHYYGGNDDKTAIRRVLQAIPNFRKIYQDMLSKATEGTGMWLLKNERFRVWLEPNGDIKIYWGSGMPGAGKTVLASIVIERLEALRKTSDEPICVCFVYFRYSDHANITLKRILEILLKQTLERHPEYYSLIEETYAQHVREGTEPTEPQLVTLLRQITGGMFATFYVLDALDEAPPGIQLKVLRTLASLKVKLFITSRPLQAVEAGFPEADTFQITAQADDIDIHIAKEINDSAGLLHLLRQEGNWLQEEIFSIIKAKSGGMFLHASLQMDALRGCVTLHQVRRVLDGFPSQIKDVYLQTWRRILEESQESASLAEAVFVWVLHAWRSMSIDELERAVATSPETYKLELDRVAPRATLIELCRGLLIVEEESQLVRLVHYTAKEHLQRLLDESFPHPHSLLANVCMTHLTESGFQNTTINSEEEFKATLQNDPLLAYASEAWPFHAKQSLGIDGISHRTARFVADSSAFPAFTSVDHTFHFDILTPLHIVGLYRLPLEFTRGLETHNPNIATMIHLQTPLMLASLSGFETFVKFLLADPKIRVNLVNDRGWSALMLTAKYGHEHIGMHLLARPEIQVNLVNNDGWSALMVTVQYGHEHIAARLFACCKTRVNLVSNDGWSALMVAAQSGDEHIAMHLLTRPEIKVNLASNSGWTALMVTAQYGHKHIATRLLAHSKIQVNLVNNDGWSALMVTIQEGHEHIAKLLLARPEIQFNLVSNKGWSALMVTARYGHKYIAELLLARPTIQVNIVDNNGWSALMVAAQDGHEHITEELLAHPETKVNLVNKDGASALMVATCYGHEHIAAHLLAQPKTQVNLVDNRGWSALSIACHYGHKGIAQAILGIDNINVNSGNVSGRTPLMIAANNGCESIVDMLLLVAGLDCTVTDKKGLTAMSLAQAQGHTGVVKLLQEFELRNSIPSEASDAGAGFVDRDASDSGSDACESFYDPEDWPE